MRRRNVAQYLAMRSREVYCLDHAIDTASLQVATYRKAHPKPSQNALYQSLCALGRKARRHADQAIKLYQAGSEDGARSHIKQCDAALLRIQHKLHPETRSPAPDREAVARHAATPKRRR